MSRKLERVRSTGKVRSLDLFAGCGGWTLGLHAAGIDVVGAVELDEAAAATWSANFASAIAGADPKGLAAKKDITELEPIEVLRMCGHAVEDAAEEIDLLVGSPPCQAFARIGRAKLREVLDHPDAYIKDPRAQLYQRYLAYVQATRPLIILMENVPEVLNHAGRNVPEEICTVLEESRYTCQYTILNSASYGVPQFRERMFLVAVHSTIQGEFSFPAATHRAVLPSGYAGMLSHALGDLAGHYRGSEETSSRYFKRPPGPASGAPDAVTAKAALSDLPAINAHRLHESGQWPGRKELSTKPLGKPTSNGYQQLMRSWPGFSSEATVSNHVIRHLPRDHRLFARMTPGMEYPALHALAETIFTKEELPRLRRSGELPKEGSKAWKKLKARLVPPYDPSKFSNKWWMLRPDLPSRTLTAHLGKDCYSHIHYDNKQARTISVREAARLQSFPDGFRLPANSMNSALKQIGNAVSPLVSYALGRAVRRTLGVEDLDPLSSATKAKHD